MILHKNPYFLVNVIDGYYSITFPTEQVIILPRVNNSQILFIQAIRPVFDKPIIELPTGTVESGETIEMAVLREPSEETEIKITDPNRLNVLPSLNSNPSRTAQMIKIFQINISMDEYEKRVSHDHEVAGTLLLAKNQVVNRIKSGEIFVAITIAICLQHIITDYKDTNYAGEPSK